MAIPAPRLRFRRSSIVTLVLSVFALVGVFFVVASGSEALEERAAAVSATDLRLAVLTVAPVNDYAALDDRGRTLFDEAAATLRGDHGDALHGVALQDRGRAADGLAETFEHTEMVRASTMVMNHSLADHSDLEELLRQAAVASSADAATSERNAGLGAGLTAFALIGLSVRMVAVRSRRQNEELRSATMQRAADRFSALLDDSPEASLIIGDDGRIIYHAASIGELFPGIGLAHRSALTQLAVSDDQEGLAAHLCAESSHRSSMTFTSTLRDAATASPREFSVSVSDLRHDALVGGWLATLREVTDEVRARKELESLARTDSLTGLPNRRALMSDLEERAGQPFSCLMVDLDDFKQTNDVFGHNAGDELLCMVAQRLGDRSGPSDRLYRLGGDEFAVITNQTHVEALGSFGASLVEAFAKPFHLRAGFEQASGSVGIAIHDSAEPGPAVLHRADIALYEAKSLGGDRVQMIDTQLEERSSRRRELGRALHNVSLDDEFRLVYQPIVDADDGTVRYLEALLRWTSPTLGSVPPDQFIPLAETSGQIVGIGLWVLNHALADLVVWRNQGLSPLVGVTVNVSPHQLDEPDFAPSVMSLLQHHGLSPHDLTIEVTESALVSGRHHNVDPLTYLRSRGCQIACDDFGSGYSNLGQLMELPLDIIKVDRELLMHLSRMRDAAGGDPSQPCQVMSAIVSIGESMGAPIIAEGIESADQQESLLSSGVSLLQGYLFSRPVESSEVLEVVQDMAPSRQLVNGH